MILLHALCVVKSKYGHDYCLFQKPRSYICIKMNFYWLTGMLLILLFQNMRFQLLLIYTLLAKTLAISLNTTQTSNPYFQNVRIDTVTFTPYQMLTRTDLKIIVPYTIPFKEVQKLECYIGLNSFYMPSNQSKIDNFWFQMSSDCKATYLQLNGFYSLFSEIIINYIVINYRGFDYKNIAFMYPTTNTDLIDHKIIKGTSNLTSFNSSAQIKYLSFLKGFKLYKKNSGNPNQSHYSLGYQISITNITYLSFDYQVSCVGTRNNFGGTIQFLVIVYNNLFFNSPKSTQCQFFADTIQYSNFTSTSTNNPVPIYPQNAAIFAGVSYFEMKGDLTFKLGLNSPKVIGLTSNGTDNKVLLNYLIFPKYIESISSSNTTAEDTFPTQQSSNNNIIIIILVVVIFVFIVILVIWCCCSGCRKQTITQNNPQQVQPAQIKKPIKSQIRQSQLLFYQLREQTCTICLTNRTQMMTPCQHYFHLKCLKLALKNKYECPVCQQLLMDRKITVFCRNCSLGYVFDLKQSMILDDQLGVDPLCLKCKKRTTGEGMSDKSDEVWLQYAIQTNQNLMAWY